jgi:hypothetical protein
MRRLGWAIILLGSAYALPAMAADVYLSDLIKKPAYARSLKALLKDAKEPDFPFWLPALLSTRGDYVSAPVEYVTIGGTSYGLINACKPHQCDDSRIEVMFAPNGTQAWGGVYQFGKPIVWLGAPNVEQQAAMTPPLQP